MKVHTDAGSAFKSAEFISDCEQHGIKVTFAAPRHQEMNGICEQAWQSICNIALALWYMLVLVMNICPLLLNMLGESMLVFPSRIYKKMEFL